MDWINIPSYTSSGLQIYGSVQSLSLSPRLLLYGNLVIQIVIIMLNSFHYCWCIRSQEGQLVFSLWNLYCILLYKFKIFPIISCNLWYEKMYNHLPCFTYTKERRTMIVNKILKSWKLQLLSNWWSLIFICWPILMTSHCMNESNIEIETSICHFILKQNRKINTCNSCH